MIPEVENIKIISVYFFDILRKPHGGSNFSHLTSLFNQAADAIQKELKAEEMEEKEELEMERQELGNMGD